MISNRGLHPPSTVHNGSVFNSRAVFESECGHSSFVKDSAYLYKFRRLRLATGLKTGYFPLAVIHVIREDPIALLPERALSP